ncbi:hypothetical protein ACCD06_28285 [Azospirillum sp. CT11-132]|uniref:hypothetical protein n=1 Tax=Azospirillum sp. CT11-132 TaxID=3396317 RepID=UPI0039A56C07
MGSKVMDFDLSPFKKAMIDSGHTADHVEACFADLLIILHDAENTGRAHAMTEGADEALHCVLADRLAWRRLGVAIHGVEMIHDANAYGTPAFGAAWENTRAAFAHHGIELPVDYLSDVGGFRSAATCVRRSQEPGEDPEDPIFKKAA